MRIRLIVLLILAFGSVAIMAKRAAASQPVIERMREGSGHGPARQSACGINGEPSALSSVFVFEDIQTVGGLSKETIEEILRKNRNQIRNCHERELRKDPDSKGRLELGLTIDSSGSVYEESILVQDAIADDVVDCVIRRLRRWKFPENDAGTDVVMLIRFDVAPARPRAPLSKETR